MENDTVGIVKKTWIGGGMNKKDKETWNLLKQKGAYIKVPSAEIWEELAEKWGGKKLSKYETTFLEFYGMRIYFNG